MLIEIVGMFTISVTVHTVTWHTVQTLQFTCYKPLIALPWFQEHTQLPKLLKYNEKTLNTGPHHSVLHKILIVASVPITGSWNLKPSHAYSIFCHIV